MRRFFIDSQTSIEDEIFLPEQESHHLQHVLRLPAGNPLQLLDGVGNIHDAEIMVLGKRVKLRILRSVHVPQDATPIRVCQSLLKGQKIELLVQKCTELGVTEFTPFYSERCQFKKKELSKVTKKYDRWRRIIEEACKQCGTPWAMRLNPLLSFEEMLRANVQEVQRILFWEEAGIENSLHSLPLKKDTYGLQVVFGPEGGFSVEEATAAKEADFQVLSLGARILKAETANIAAVSIVQHLLGNM